MKTKILLFVLIILSYSAITVIAQKPVYPKPNSKFEIPFSEKLPSPTDLNFKFKADNHSNNQSPQTLPVSGSSFNKTRLLALAKITHQRNNNASQNTNNTNANFHLTKDINIVGDGYPVNSDYNNDDFKASFALLNNVAYFNATDGINGAELWRSDGTAAGTYMVKDINAGAATSGPYNITATNGKLYFSAFTDDYGWEPWISDGTEAGTQILLDINSGNASSYPAEFVRVNNAVFFTVSNDYGSILWKTDGTSAGTQLVYDFTAYEMYSGYVTEAIASNGLYFFSAYTPTYGRELWRSDGTQAGTFIVKDIDPDQTNQVDYYSPLQLTNYDHKLYFSGDDGSGRKLWVSDGTSDGTYPVTNNNNILIQTDFLNYTFNYPFAILNNVLFFGGYSPTDANGLYKFNASNIDGVKLAKDFTSTFDVDYLVPTTLIKSGSALYFKVINSIGYYHDELWTSQGKTNNTQLVKSFEPNHVTTNYYDGYGTLYFNEDDPVYGTELWKSNGTEQTTDLIKDVFTGNGSSYPSFLTPVNGKIIFTATNIKNGAELWSTDGADAVLIKDINPGNTTNNSDAGFFYKGIVRDTHNGVLFGAFTPEHGGELYKSDGTKYGTQFLNDIAAGTGWSYPNSFLFKNNVDYFIGDNLIGTAIYKTDGTKNGLQQVVYNIDRSIYYVTNFNVTDNGLPLYILGNKNTGAYELWRSDGTVAGTYALNINLYYNAYLVTIGNIAFFVAGDDVHGYELWKTDGTSAGTMIVKDIYKGINGAYPYSLFAYKDEIYFAANDGGLNYSFWKSDGTKTGTVKLKNITPAYYDYNYNYGVQYFCISNDTLYFDATDFNEYGAELWKTDGTKEGTRLVKDINRTSYPYYSNPSNLTDVNGILFFTADDGIDGTELWRSNGTKQGTNMVKDITPGFDLSYLHNLINANGKLYFLYNDELWQSDGTGANTTQVTDNGLNGLSQLTNLTASGNKLFFGAYSLKYGTELYVGNTASNCFIAAKTNADNISVSPRINTAFKASLLNNPVTDQIKISIDTKTQQQASVIITDMSGRTIITDKKILSAGINMFSYDAKALTQGIYMIHIITAEGPSFLLKAVK